MAPVANSGGTGSGAAHVGSAYQIGPGTWVELTARVFDAEGELVLGAEDAVRFVFGFGQLLPKVEQALQGLESGASVAVELRADDAYGPRDESLIVAVDRSELPDPIGPGDRIEVEDPHGAVLVLRVLEVEDEAALVDFNHPLAGQKIRVELEIASVRPASEAEILAAERALAGAEAHTTGLLTPERLLRGVGRSYESALAGAGGNGIADTPQTTRSNEPGSGSPIEEKKA